MKVRMAHCLFEQSGTFKKAFQEFNIPAEDYDIRNDFGETDNLIDLFAEIENAYEFKPSLFDKISSEDLVLAFFPCTRFECQSQMLLNGNHYTMKSWTDEQKLVYALETHKELHALYTLICKLFIISNRGGVEDDCRKPGNSSALFDLVFPGQAGNHRQRPHKERGLLQKANPVLVC